MLTKTNPLSQRSPQDLFALCEAGDKAACTELTKGKVGWKANSVGANRPNLTYGMSGPVQSLAEGGEALLAPAQEDVDGEFEEYEQDDYTYEDTSDELDNFDITPLLSTLNEQESEELVLALEQFPVVIKLAKMATMTDDGMVDGMGGPKDDDVPAQLSAGEFVIPEGLVDELGKENLESLLNDWKSRAAAQQVV